MCFRETIKCMNGHALFGGAQLKEGSLNGVSNQPGHVTNNMYNTQAWTLGQRTPDPWVDLVRGLLDYPCGSPPISEDEIGTLNGRNCGHFYLQGYVCSSYFTLVQFCLPYIMVRFCLVKE